MHAPLLLMPPTSPATHTSTADQDDWQITDIWPGEKILEDSSKALMRVAIEHIDEDGNTHFGASCYITIDWSNDEHNDAARAAIEHLIKKHDDHIDALIERDPLLELGEEEED